MSWQVDQSASSSLRKLTAVQEKETCSVSTWRLCCWPLLSLQDSLSLWLPSLSRILLLLLIMPSAKQCGELGCWSGSEMFHVLCVSSWDKTIFWFQESKKNRNWIKSCNMLLWIVVVFLLQALCRTLYWYQDHVSHTDSSLQPWVYGKNRCAVDDVLDQGCPNYGPGSKCGPQAILSIFLVLYCTS